MTERDGGVAAADIWGLPLLGSVYPQCDIWGRYRSKQCRNGECTCVDPASGVSLEDTSCLSDTTTTLYSSYFNEDIQIAPLVEQAPSSCLSQQQLVNLNLTDHVISMKLPLCSEDGGYFPQQFRSDIGSWWCVDPRSGEELSGERGARHTLPCSGAGLGQVLFQSVTIHGCVTDEIVRVVEEGAGSGLTCEDYLYTSVQCLAGDGNQCFCVTSDTGIHLSLSYSRRSQLSCPDMSETVCLREQFQACSDDTTPLLLSSCPETCDQETGNFLPQQCDNDTCYCVNIHTGLVI